MAVVSEDFTGLGDEFALVTEALTDAGLSFGAWFIARQAPGARRATPCASGRQDALRRPLGEPGFVGEPNFTLHLHLRLRLGDLAATDLVWQKLHQEVRKSERGRGVHGARGRTPGWRPQSRPGCPRAE